MRRLFWAPALGLALGACVGVAYAAPRVEAEPGRDYPLTADAGEWMILAATFTGEAAPDLALQLVYQIRSRHNLPAYTVNFTDPELLKQREELHKEHHSIRMQATLGVVVGGYK